MFDIQKILPIFAVLRFNKIYECKFLTEVIMKKYILTLAALAMVVCASAADFTPMSQKIAKKLNLTDSQKWSIEDVNYDFKISADKWNATQKDYEQSLKAILTPQQFMKYQEMRAKEVEQEKEYKQKQLDMARAAYGY